MLIRDAMLGEALAKTLGSKTVALMQGHGNVVVGPTLQHGRKCHEQAAREHRAGVGAVANAGGGK